MATIKTIPEILNIARVAQYLAFNDQANKLFLKGGNNARLPYMITCERLSVQWQYDTDPTDTTLRGTANYLYDLLGIYGIQAEAIIAARGDSPPTVTGPNDVTVTVGGTASFTISYTSTIPATVAWFIDGVLVPGETGTSYSFIPTLGQSGSIINAVVTNGAGSTPSANATLTVTTAITGQYYAGDVDYYSFLSIGVDNVPYLASFNITNGQPLSVLFGAAGANNKWNVVKFPDTQSVKTSWFSTDFDNGAIPDIAYRDIISFGGFRYIISRNALSLDPSVPVIYS